MGASRKGWAGWGMEVGTEVFSRKRWHSIGPLFIYALSLTSLNALLPLLNSNEPLAINLFQISRLL